MLKPGERWRVDCADCLDWLGALAPDSLDLLLCSPPYEAARTYGVGFKLRGQAWVDWMVAVVRAALRVTGGLVAVVCEGQTHNYCWSAAPALLLADLHRAGVHLRKPPAYRRYGIPGSGGPDWLRNDYEFVVCATRGGRLPWSDPTAMGHRPRWAPGGEMSHRNPGGKRVNAHGVRRDGVRIGGRRGKDCRRAGEETPDHASAVITRHRDGMHAQTGGYLPPVLANPGNVITCKVGGGLLGHPLAHDSEAPFPLRLAEFFVLSFCPPGGVVGDCFCGSGTTGHAALNHARRFLGCDLRPGKGGCETARRRLSLVTPGMFG